MLATVVLPALTTLPSAAAPVARPRNRFAREVQAARLCPNDCKKQPAPQFDKQVCLFQALGTLSRDIEHVSAARAARTWNLRAERGDGRLDDPDQSKER